LAGFDENHYHSKDYTGRGPGQPSRLDNHGQNWLAQDETYLKKTAVTVNNGMVWWICLKYGNGLLQRHVCWLSCQSADAVAVCIESSCSSCARVAWPCISISGHAQLVTLAGLSTTSYIQVMLAYIQVFA